MDTSVTFIYTAQFTAGDIVSDVRSIAYVPLSCDHFGTVSSPSIAPCLFLCQNISWPPSRVRQGRRAERRGASAERRPVFIETCPTAAVDTPLGQA